MKRRTALTVLAAGPLVLLVACGGARPATIQVSVAETYYDLEELTEQSDVIATGHPVSSDVDRSEGIPWTLSTVVIDTIFTGEIADTMTLRQTGTTNEAAEGVAPVVEVGPSYVFYLRHYELAPGEPTGEYVPLTVGVFEIDGDRAIIPEAARDLPDFPETVELAALEAMAAASADPAPSDGSS
ncbi:hypothetical protein [Brachybacterium tyrofermentans]|uniref:hypothetical protein n=1 Tax=Brachybacterium tyrofermentans TaxID=47848 RepID=UPI003FB81B8A